MEAVACQRILALQELDPTHLRHDNDGASHPAVRAGAAADRIETVAERRLETHRAAMALASHNVRVAHQATNKAELDHALMKRYGSGVNHFRLFIDRSEWPSLIIMVSGEVAWLYFLSSSEHAGYHSVGAVPGLDPKGWTRFVSLGPQEEFFRNDQVVPLADALRAAEEFSVTRQLPQCVDWYELA